MVIRSIIAAVASLLLAGQVHAARVGYDIKKNILTIPSIVVEGVRYNFPKVRIVSVEVVDPGVSSRAPSGLPICNGARDSAVSIRATQEKLDQIQLGMTLDEVNQIIGCQYETPTNNSYDDGEYCSLDPNDSSCDPEPTRRFEWRQSYCGDFCVRAIFVEVDVITRRVIGKDGVFNDDFRH